MSAAVVAALPEFISDTIGQTRSGRRSMLGPLTFSLLCRVRKTRRATSRRCDGGRDEDARTRFYFVPSPRTPLYDSRAVGGDCGLSFPASCGPYRLTRGEAYFYPVREATNEARQAAARKLR